MDPLWFKNAVDVLESKEGWRPTRFTAKQLLTYASNEAQGIRSRCSSGSMLDILTDATYIQIEYILGDATRQWFYFDIYVNGMFTESIGTDRIEDRAGKFRYNLENSKGRIASEDKNRVTIYLPHLLEISISQIQFSEGATVEAAPSEAKNLLCLGDSITQGMDAKRPSSAYPVILSRFLNMNLLNHGVGGYMFNKSSIDPELPYKPDLITVAYGTNDWGKYANLSELRQHSEEYMDTLTQLYTNTPILLLTPIWRKDLDQAKPMGTFYELVESIREIGQSYPNVKLIDGLGLVPHLPQFFGDGTVHPNDEGFLHMAQGILKQL